MSKFTNYLKENQDEILMAMMGTNSLLPGADANWRLMAARGRK